MTVERWEARLDELAGEAARIKADGKWRTGPHTLMQVLNLHRLEVPVVALLAWMLQPEGHHGLGDHLVRRLFGRLGLPFDRHARVRVSREEARTTPNGAVTRADLVVRVGGVCALVEAKVDAEQHGDQCTRLERLWGPEADVLVYLTRDHRDVDAPSGWRSLTWSDVAGLMTPLPERASAGAREVLETLRMLDPRERPLMLDEKTQFYLRHWSLLSEWAALRSDAVVSIEAALAAVTARPDPGAVTEWIFQPPQRFPTFELLRPSWERGELRIAIALQWDRDKLLTDAGPWPYVGVRVTGIAHRARDPFVRALTESLEQSANGLGWTELDLGNGWLWWRAVGPTDAGDVPGSVAAACSEELGRGWQALSGRIDRFLLSHP